MPQPENQPDPLDVLLREEEHYIEDAGFTARVMASLPPRRKSWLRPVILSSATLLGVVVLMCCVPMLQGIFHFEPNGGLVLNFNQSSILMLAGMLAGATALAWGVFAMLRWED